MPGRVVVDTSRIAVSKPGVEVTTATLDKLLLSIDARLGQVLYSGYIAGTSGTISYPTLPRLPDAIAQMVYSLGAGNFITKTEFWRDPPSVVNSDFWFSGSLMQISIGLSSTTFTASTTPAGLSVGIRYLIFRKPLAA